MKIYLWCENQIEMWSGHPDARDHIGEYKFTLADKTLISYIKRKGKEVEAKSGRIWELELDD